MTYLEERT